MSRENVESVIGKSFLDDQFRSQVMANPFEAAASIGRPITPEEASMISAANVEITNAASGFCTQLAASSPAAFVDIHVH